MFSHTSNISILKVWWKTWKINAQNSNRMNGEREMGENRLINFYITLKDKQTFRKCLLWCQKWWLLSNSNRLTYVAAKRCEWRLFIRWYFFLRVNEIFYKKKVRRSSNFVNEQFWIVFFSRHFARLSLSRINWSGRDGPKQSQNWTVLIDARKAKNQMKNWKHWYWFIYSMPFKLANIYFILVHRSFIQSHRNVALALII